MRGAPPILAHGVNAHDPGGSIYLEAVNRGYCFQRAHYKEQHCDPSSAEKDTWLPGPEEKVLGGNPAKVLPELWPPLQQPLHPDHCFHLICGRGHLTDPAIHLLLGVASLIAHFRQIANTWQGSSFCRNRQVITPTERSGLLCRKGAVLSGRVRSWESAGPPLPLQLCASSEEGALTRVTGSYSADASGQDPWLSGTGQKSSVWSDILSQKMAHYSLLSGMVTQSGKETIQAGAKEVFSIGV